jgi:hypothetical protein
MNGQARQRGVRIDFVAPLVVLLCAAVVIALTSLGSDEQIAFAVLSLTPVFLIALYVLIQGVVGDRLMGVLSAIVYIFLATAVFRTRGFDDKSIDFQVAGRLLAFGMIFVTAFLFFNFALGRFRFPRLFFVWFLFFAALIGCALYSPNVVFALTCAVFFMACYLYSVYMTVWLSRPRAVLVMMCVALLLCAGSIFVYYAIPSIGLVQAWNPETQAWTAEKAVGEVGRMRGIVGTPNGVGFVAAFAIVLSVLYFRVLPPFGKWVAAGILPAAAVCLVLSANRNSMFAVAVALWVAFVLRKGTGPKLVITTTLGLVGAVAFVAFSDEIFSLLSRSGNASEVTTLTGRSEIWAVVIQKWMEQPLYGYGYTSALSILPLDPRLFHAAAHTHNMLLEVLFSGGLILVALFLFGLGETIVQIRRLGAVNEAALVAFFLVRGLTEPTPFGSMTGFGSFAFTLTVALVIGQLVAVPTRIVRVSRGHSLSARGAARVPLRSPLRPV